MRKPRGRQRGKSYTISCTNAELEAIRAGAAKAGKNVSQWFVECALTVDPWPERRKRLVLDAGQQRAVVRGVDEIARGLGAAPAARSGAGSREAAAIHRGPSGAVRGAAPEDGGARPA